MLEGICTVKEASAMFGIPVTTLNFWDETDFIRPQAKRPIGRRYARMYTFCDLVALKMANQLREAGVSLQALRRIVNHLKEIYDIETPLATTILVTIGNDVCELISETELLSRLKKPGQFIMQPILVDMSAVVESVTENIKKMEGLKIQAA